MDKAHLYSKEFESFYLPLSVKETSCMVYKGVSGLSLPWNGVTICHIGECDSSYYVST